MEVTNVVEKDFDRFYDEVLVQSMQGLEAQRNKARKYLMAAFGVIGFMILSVLLLIISGGNKIFVVTIIASVVVIGVFIVLYNYQANRYTVRFKGEIILRIIKFINPSFQYLSDRYINRNDYLNSGLFLEQCDAYKGEDFISGRYGDTDFCFSELHTEHRVSNGKSSYYETIFKGLFFMADFNKNFNGRTYVWSESDPQLNFFNKLFSSFGYHLEEVSLESPEFERRFIVYSNDQVESRYILTPSMMERMVKLQDIFEANIVFSFVDTNVHLAIPIDAELFEPTISSPADKQKMKQYYNTVNAMLLIIDELNLNRRIWSKD